MQRSLVDDGVLFALRLGWAKIMAVDKGKGQDNPFASALREERDLELEGDRLSWKRALLIKRKYDAQAAGDSALAAELGVRIAELRRRRRALYE